MYDRTVAITKDLSFDSLYVDENGQKHRMSLTRLLLHEFEHSIDPGLAGDGRKALKMVQDFMGYSEREACQFIIDLNSPEQPPQSRTAA